MKRDYPAMKLCLACGASFPTYNSAQYTRRKYCSTKCMGVGLSANRPKREITHLRDMVCLNCGKQYKSYIKNVKIFCCIDCRKAYMTKPNRVCLGCGKQFYAKRGEINRGGGKYCSYSCSTNRVKSGENHYRWKGGITPQKKKLRNSVAMKDWRYLVFTRDGYKCVKCGTGKSLNAHHIIPVSADNSLMFEITNGITLCAGCHKKEHKRLIEQQGDQNDIFSVQY